MINIALVACIGFSIAATPLLVIGCIIMMVKRIKEKKEEKETI